MLETHKTERESGVDKNGLFGLRGHVESWIVYPDGTRVLHFSDHNQVTDLYLQTIVQLLGQKTTFLDPTYNAIHSIWFEASAADIPDPARTDVTYAAGATVIAQEVIADADRDASLVGTTRVLNLRASIDAATGVGQKIRAVGLYTRGDSNTPPSPIGFTSGIQDVTLCARQKMSPIDKGAFAVEIRWSLYFDINS